MYSKLSSELTVEQQQAAMKDIFDCDFFSQYIVDLHSHITGHGFKMQLGDCDDTGWYRVADFRKHIYGLAPTLDEHMKSQLTFAIPSDYPKPFSEKIFGDGDMGPPIHIQFNTHFPRRILLRHNGINVHDWPKEEGTKELTAQREWYASLTSTFEEILGSNSLSHI